MNKPSQPDHKILTVDEVSAYLKIPVSTVYYLTHQGKIPAVKFGKHWRYLEEDILTRFKNVSHETSRATLKVIALVSLICFTSTNISWSYPARQPEPNSKPVKKLGSSLRIPKEIGTIEALHIADPKKPFVVLIQDAHAVLGAQESIRKLIQYFQDRYQILLTALEGTEGRLDPTLFRTFPNEIAKKKNLRSYLERGELNGAEMAAILNPKEGNYYGIEDAGLYEKNYEAYLKAAANQEVIGRRLEKVKGELDEKRMADYSKPLNTFYETSEAFYDETTNLSEFLEGVSKQFGDGLLERDRYPHLFRMMKFLELEKKGRSLPPTRLPDIKGKKLLEELEILIDAAEQKLISTAVERRLSQAYKKLRVLQKLTALELTHKEWLSLSQNPQDYFLILSSDLFEPAMEFYRLAINRDQVLFRNLNRLMKKEKTKTAIVLAGGFHTAGLESLLKKAGYSYVTVTPKMNSLEDKAVYPDLMQGNLSYKAYLNKSFYDAFARHATLSLVSTLSEYEFGAVLKTWRDNLIRKLSAEGWIEQSGSYTKYLDQLLAVYVKKFADIPEGHHFRKRLLRKLERETIRFADRSARQFSNPLTHQSAAASSLFSLVSPRVALAPHFKSEIYQRVVRGEYRLVRSELRWEPDWLTEFQLDGDGPLSGQERLANQIREARRMLALPYQGGQGWMRGNNWVRVSASMKEAYEFHKNWRFSQADRAEKFTFDGLQYAVNQKTLRKAAEWFLGNPEFERNGFFVGRRENDLTRIYDFIPNPSYAADPELVPVGKADPLTRQSTWRFGQLFPKEVEHALGLYDSRYEIPKLEGAQLFYVHSHPAWGKYANRPAPGDSKDFDYAEAEFIFGLKEKVFLVFNQKGMFQDFPLVTERSELRNHPNRPEDPFAEARREYGESFAEVMGELRKAQRALNAGGIRAAIQEFAYLISWEAGKLHGRPAVIDTGSRRNSNLPSLIFIGHMKEPKFQAVRDAGILYLLSIRPVPLMKLPVAKLVEIAGHPMSITDREAAQEVLFELVWKSQEFKEFFPGVHEALRKWLTRDFGNIPAVQKILKEIPPARSELRSRIRDQEEKERAIRINQERRWILERAVSLEPLPLQDLLPATRLVSGLPRLENWVREIPRRMDPEAKTVFRRTLAGDFTQKVTDNLQAKLESQQIIRVVLREEDYKTYLAQKTDLRKLVWVGDDGRFYILGKFYDYLRTFTSGDRYEIRTAYLSPEAGRGATPILAAVLLRLSTIDLFINAFRQSQVKRTVAINGVISKLITSLEEQITGPSVVPLSAGQNISALSDLADLWVYGERFKSRARPEIVPVFRLSEASDGEQWTASFLNRLGSAISGYYANRRLLVEVLRESRQMERMRLGFRDNIISIREDYIRRGRRFHGLTERTVQGIQSLNDRRVLDQKIKRYSKRYEEISGKIATVSFDPTQRRRLEKLNRAALQILARLILFEIHPLRIDRLMERQDVKVGTPRYNALFERFRQLRYHLWAFGRELMWQRIREAGRREIAKYIYQEDSVRAGDHDERSAAVLRPEFFRSFGREWHPTLVTEGGRVNPEKWAAVRREVKTWLDEKGAPTLIRTVHKAPEQGFPSDPAIPVPAPFRYRSIFDLLRVHSHTLESYANANMTAHELLGELEDILKVKTAIGSRKFKRLGAGLESVEDAARRSILNGLERIILWSTRGRKASRTALGEQEGSPAQMALIAFRYGDERVFETAIRAMHEQLQNYIRENIRIAKYVALMEIQMRDLVRMPVLKLLEGARISKAWPELERMRRQFLPARFNAAGYKRARKRLWETLERLERFDGRSLRNAGDSPENNEMRRRFFDQIVELETVVYDVIYKYDSDEAFQKKEAAIRQEIAERLLGRPLSLTPFTRETLDQLYTRLSASTARRSEMRSEEEDGYLNQTVFQESDTDKHKAEFLRDVLIPKRQEFGLFGWDEIQQAGRLLNRINITFKQILARKVAASRELGVEGSLSLMKQIGAVPETMKNYMRDLVQLDKEEKTFVARLMQDIRKLPLEELGKKERQYQQLIERKKWVSERFSNDILSYLSALAELEDAAGIRTFRPRSELRRSLERKLRTAALSRQAKSELRPKSNDFGTRRNLRARRSEIRDVTGSKNVFKKVRGSEDRNTVKRRKDEQVFITGNDKFSVAGQGTLKDSVVLGVAADSDSVGRTHHDGRFLNQSEKILAFRWIDQLMPFGAVRDMNQFFKQGSRGKEFETLVQQGEDNGPSSPSSEKSAQKYVSVDHDAHRNSGGQGQRTLMPFESAGNFSDVGSQSWRGVDGVLVAMFPFPSVAPGKSLLRQEAARAIVPPASQKAPPKFFSQDPPLTDQKDSVPGDLRQASTPRSELRESLLDILQHRGVSGFSQYLKDQAETWQQLAPEDALGLLKQLADVRLTDEILRRNTQPIGVATIHENVIGPRILDLIRITQKHDIAQSETMLREGLTGLWKHVHVFAQWAPLGLFYQLQFSPEFRILFGMLAGREEFQDTLFQSFIKDDNYLSSQFSYLLFYMLEPGLWDEMSSKDRWHQKLKQWLPAIAKKLKDKKQGADLLYNLSDLEHGAKSEREAPGKRVLSSLIRLNPEVFFDPEIYQRLFEKSREFLTQGNISCWYFLSVLEEELEKRNRHLPDEILDGLTADMDRMRAQLETSDSQLRVSSRHIQEGTKRLYDALLQRSKIADKGQKGGLSLLQRSELRHSVRAKFETLIKAHPEFDLNRLARELGVSLADEDFKDAVSRHLYDLPKYILHEHSSGLIDAENLLPFFLGDSEEAREARRRFALTLRAYQGNKDPVRYQARPDNPASIDQNTADQIFNEYVQGSPEKLKRFVTYEDYVEKDYQKFEWAFAFIKAVTDVNPSFRTKLIKDGLLKLYHTDHVRYFELTDFHSSSLEELLAGVLEAEHDAANKLHVGILKAFRKDYLKRIRQNGNGSQIDRPYRKMSLMQTRNKVFQEAAAMDKHWFGLTHESSRKRFDEAYEEIEALVKREANGHRMTRREHEHLLKQRLIEAHEARKLALQEMLGFEKELQELDRKNPRMRKKIVGISSIGDEADYINWIQELQIRRAGQIGLKVTSHIGERWHKGDYLTALRRVKRELELGIDRAAHLTILGVAPEEMVELTSEQKSTAAALQREIFRLLKKNGTHVETNPTSQRIFSPVHSDFEHHVSGTLLKEGISFSVHPDDASILNTSPSQEFIRLWFSHPDWSYQTLLNAVNAPRKFRFYKYVDDLIAHFNQERWKLWEAYKTLRPAVVIFGSARIPPGHPLYRQAVEIGKWLYRLHFSIITGAGPGMMEAPLVGYADERKKSGDTIEEWNKIQGVRIEFNRFEPTNPYVDILFNFPNFIFRKPGLYLNSLAIFAMPGGIGTLDEFFESWELGRPPVLIGNDFWEPILKALYQSWDEEGLLDEVKVYPRIVDYTHSSKAPEFIKEFADQKPEPYDPGWSRTDIEAANEELKNGFVKLNRLPSPVVIAGSGANSNGEWDILIGTIRELLSRNVPVRVASRGRLLERVLEIARELGKENLLQFILYKGPADTDWTAEERNLQSRLPRQTFLLNNDNNYRVLATYYAESFLFTPGTLRLMNLLFDTIGSIQTHTIRRKPIILIGKNFWGNIFKTLEQVMERHDPPLVSPGDFHLARIVNSEAAALEHLGYGKSIQRSELRGARVEPESVINLGIFTTLERDLTQYLPSEIKKSGRKIQAISLIPHATSLRQVRLGTIPFFLPLLADPSFSPEEIGRVVSGIFATAEGLRKIRLVQVMIERRRNILLIVPLTPGQNELADSPPSERSPAIYEGHKFAKERSELRAVDLGTAVLVLAGGLWIARSPELLRIFNDQTVQGRRARDLWSRSERPRQAHEAHASISQQKNILFWKVVIKMLIITGLWWGWNFQNLNPKIEQTFPMAEDKKMSNALPLRSEMRSKSNNIGTRRNLSAGRSEVRSDSETAKPLTIQTATNLDLPPVQDLLDILKKEKIAVVRREKSEPAEAEPISVLKKDVLDELAVEQGISFEEFLRQLGVQEDPGKVKGVMIINTRTENLHEALFRQIFYSLGKVTDEEGIERTVQKVLNELLQILFIRDNQLEHFRLKHADWTVEEMKTLKHWLLGSDFDPNFDLFSINLRLIRNIERGSAGSVVDLLLRKALLPGTYSRKDLDTELLRELDSLPFMAFNKHHPLFPHWRYEPFQKPEKKSRVPKLFHDWGFRAFAMAFAADWITKGFFTWFLKDEQPIETAVDTMETQRAALNAWDMPFNIYFHLTGRYSFRPLHHYLEDLNTTFLLKLLIPIIFFLLIFKGDSLWKKLMYGFKPSSVLGNYSAFSRDLFLRLKSNPIKILFGAFFGAMLGNRLELILTGKVTDWLYVTMLDTIFVVENLADMIQDAVMILGAYGLIPLLFFEPTVRLISFLWRQLNYILHKTKDAPASEVSTTGAGTEHPSLQKRSELRSHTKQRSELRRSLERKLRAAALSRQAKSELRNVVDRVLPRRVEDIQKTIREWVDSIPPLERRRGNILWPDWIDARTNPTGEGWSFAYKDPKTGEIWNYALHSEEVSITSQSHDHFAWKNPEPWNPSALDIQRDLAGNLRVIVRDDLMQAVSFTAAPNIREALERQGILVPEQDAIRASDFYQVTVRPSIQLTYEEKPWGAFHSKWKPLDAAMMILADLSTEEIQGFQSALYDYLKRFGGTDRQGTIETIVRKQDTYFLHDYQIWIQRINAEVFRFQIIRTGEPNTLAASGTVSTVRSEQRQAARTDAVPGASYVFSGPSSFRRTPESSSWIPDRPSAVRDDRLTTHGTLRSELRRRSQSAQITLKLVLRQLYVEVREDKVPYSSRLQLKQWIQTEILKRTGFMFTHQELISQSRPFVRKIYLGILEFAATRAFIRTNRRYLSKLSASARTLLEQRYEKGMSWGDINRNGDGGEKRFSMSAYQGYLQHMIRGALRQLRLEADSEFRLIAQFRQGRRRLTPQERKIMRLYAPAYGVGLTIEDLAEELGRPPEEMEAVIQKAKNKMTLDRFSEEQIEWVRRHKAYVRYLPLRQREVIQRTHFERNVQVDARSELYEAAMNNLKALSRPGTPYHMIETHRPQFESALEKLFPRRKPLGQADVLRALFPSKGIPLSEAVAAQRYGVKRQRVQQLKDEALLELSRYWHYPLKGAFLADENSLWKQKLERVLLRIFRKHGKIPKIETLRRKVGGERHELTPKLLVYLLERIRALENGPYRLALQDLLARLEYGRSLKISLRHTGTHTPKVAPWTTEDILREHYRKHKTIPRAAEFAKHQRVQVSEAKARQIFQRDLPGIIGRYKNKRGWKGFARALSAASTATHKVGRPSLHRSELRRSLERKLRAAALSRQAKSELRLDNENGAPPTQLDLDFIYRSIRILKHELASSGKMNDGYMQLLLSQRIAGTTSAKFRKTYRVIFNIEKLHMPKLWKLAASFEKTYDNEKSSPKTAEAAKKYLRQIKILSLALTRASRSLEEVVREGRVDDEKKIVSRIIFVHRLASYQKFLLTENFRGEPRSFNLEKSIRRIANYFEHKDDPIHIDIRPIAADLKVWADEDHLTAVWHNLFNNAREAGATRISVEAAVNGETVQVIVADNGSGIPVGIQRKLFSMPVTTKADGDHGIGLDLTQRIVHDAGGRITFESEAGKGTTFIIDLPLTEKLNVRSELRKVLNQKVIQPLRQKQTAEELVSAILNDNEFGVQPVERRLGKWAERVRIADLISRLRWVTVSMSLRAPKERSNPDHPLKIASSRRFATGRLMDSNKVPTQVRRPSSAFRPPRNDMLKTFESINSPIHFLLQPENRELLQKAFFQKFGRELKLSESSDLVFGGEFLRGDSSESTRQWIESLAAHGAVTVPFEIGTEREIPLLKTPGVRAVGYNGWKKFSILPKQASQAFLVLPSDIPIGRMPINENRKKGVLVPVPLYLQSQLNAAELNTLSELVLEVEALRKQLNDQPSLILREMTPRALRAAFGMLEDLARSKMVQQAISQAA